MNPTTLVTVKPRGRSRAAIQYVVAGVYGIGRRTFTDYQEASEYMMELAYGGTRRDFVLVG